MFSSRGLDKDLMQKSLASLKELDQWFKFQNKIGSRWFADTENLSMVDIHVFPVLERYSLLE
jgi:hypothetical protein